MKRINESYQTIIATQLSNTIKLVVSKQVKIASIIVPEIESIAVLAALKKTALKYNTYSLEGLKLILIAKDEKLFTQLEEINEAPINKELKDYFYNDILKPK